MPETPDFDKIAAQLVPAPYAALVVDALRLSWNARGTADLIKLEAELSGLMGVTAAGPYVKNLDRALRSLDR